MKLKQLINDFVTKRSESAKLWQIFPENSRLSKLALRNFERALAARGMQLSDQVMRQARMVTMFDRQLTVGDFLDHHLKLTHPPRRDKSARLTWGKR